MTRDPSRRETQGGATPNDIDIATDGCVTPARRIGFRADAPGGRTGPQGWGPTGAAVQGGLLVAALIALFVLARSSDRVAVPAELTPTGLPTSTDQVTTPRATRVIVDTRSPPEPIGRPTEPLLGSETGLWLFMAARTTCSDSISTPERSPGTKRQRSRGDTTRSDDALHV